MHSRASAAAGSLVFLAVAPGVVAGLVPWLISGWRLLPGWPLWCRLVGALLIAVGSPVLIAAFAQFVVEGRGTPAPIAPTEELVVHGLYRWVRNPMYLSVGLVLLGQSLMLPSAGIAGWLAAYLVAVVGFVLGYEQPTLRRRYGAAYDAYCRAVPAWRPRLTPWAGPSEH